MGQFRIRCAGPDSETSYTTHLPLARPPPCRDATTLSQS
jgi:hypothetical protein